MKKFDLSIIGNGPAGLTAAIYAARYGINQVLIGDVPGGLMTVSHKICNYPSEKEISGINLSEKMMDQIDFLGVPKKMAHVNNVTKLNNELFEIKLSNNETIRSKTILLATGTIHRRLGLLNENKLIGKGISYCATCDGSFYKNKIVAVIGGSDSANTYSIYLSQIANKVYQIYRGNALRGETAWINQIKENKKIKVIYNNQVSKLIGKEKLLKIELEKKYNGRKEIKLDGLFIAIGSEPNKKLPNQLFLKITDKNYIIVNSDQSTSEKGVWAAGDITTNSNNFRQIITACSEGAIAAESIFKYLSI
jgi:thioredoxin reductase (NADPH)